MKHTPGRWCVRDLPTAQRYIGPANDGGAPSVAFVLARANAPDEQIAADARLIAAAPELLDALQVVTDHFASVIGGPMFAGVTFANGVDGIPTISQARAAIKRATGEA